MQVRELRIFIEDSEGNAEFASGYFVQTLPAGATAAQVSSGTTITVDAGHGFENDHWLIVNTDVSTFRRVITANPTSLLIDGTGVTVGIGDLLVNLGDDSGSTEPEYDSDLIPTYSDMDGSTANTASTVTTSADGRARYWFAGTDQAWELVRDPDNLPLQVFTDISAGQVVAPSSSTDNAVALFDGTGGRLLKSSVVSIASGAVTGVTTLNASGIITGTGINAGGAITGATTIAASSSVSAASVATTGNITSSGGLIGYATGAGGTATQLTNKSTAVEINESCGQITMNNASLASDTTVTFTLTNSLISATDLLILNHVSGGTAGAYTLNAQCANGSATINVRNITAAPLLEAVVIGFAVINGVTT